MYEKELNSTFSQLQMWMLNMILQWKFFSVQPNPEVVMLEQNAIEEDLGGVIVEQEYSDVDVDIILVMSLDTTGVPPGL